MTRFVEQDEIGVLQAQIDLAYFDNSFLNTGRSDACCN